MESIFSQEEIDKMIKAVGGDIMTGAVVKGATPKNQDLKEYKAYMRGYEDGLNDAWEAARKIILVENAGGVPYAQVFDIFHESNVRKILRDYSASEAIEKLKAYEKKKAEDAVIKIGDEVTSDAFDDKGIVTYISADGQYIALVGNGSYMMKVGRMGLHKTGRSFPLMKEILKELQEET